MKQETRIVIDVSDLVVSQAAHYIVEADPRWTLCRSSDGADVRLTGTGGQRWSHHAAAVILVVPLQPAEASRAIDAFTAGTVNGIVATDELEHLPEAITAVTTGLAPVSLRIRDAAEHMPRLSERKMAVMAKLAAGCSYAATGDQLHISESTVKREIQGLFAAFEVNSRSALLAAAAAAGVVFG
ncbi:LuxR C-terminal-related transcriptional regulator [Umezawaea endophytica]|uniref:LuxR C-terminal-related transcriptional regulator n=1 Tax=Umezawaea endophytica TaxID=1654476 RepID=A0A9X2VPC2_9PSEU|nr:LuxR C-terminal-related transcriptional regulator [Umezawaea endophytica]MCS7480355.1 LuxR C-terminal-related transcriptional regulator [Umezawaea endophytica]